MPTGTGKTICFLSVIRMLEKKALVLVHRQELLDQTYEKALKIGFSPEEISVIKAGNKEEFSKLNIAMVQSLNNSLHLYPSSAIEMIVVDEAHHALAQSYINLFKYFEVFEREKTLLGFTATPLRGDGKSLGSIFIEQTFKMTLQEATQKGYICPVHGLRIQLSYDLENVENTGGDYNIGQLDKIVNCEEANEIVASKCSTVMRKPCVVFCSTVDHAEKIKEKLIKKDCKAETISYLNSKSECAEIFRKLKDGEIDFILNAVKLTEGFDHPPIQTVVIARPTRSPALYKQMIGRGLRLSPNKFDCLVMEFGTNDPKMITWDQIDENATFQSYTPKELTDAKTAFKTYAIKFSNPNLKVLDVRVSPFSFYECYIRRLFKYKKDFLVIPFDDGFMFGELYNYRMSKGYANLKQMKVFMLLWKEKYKSFTCYSSAPSFYQSDYGWEAKECMKQMLFYADHVNEGKPIGKWYPSEEEPMSPYQKKMLPNEKTNARKAEMIIEEKIIGSAIDKFWIKQPFPKLEEDHEGNCTDSRVFVI